MERLPSVRQHNFAIIFRDSRSSPSQGPRLPPFEVVDVRRLDHADHQRVLQKAFATTEVHWMVDLMFLTVIRGLLVLRKMRNNLNALISFSANDEEDEEDE
ncbi:hypothetical protein Cni_G16046 [Canna indica]|uniref:Uncharacterized protein n=1 Tax=Canna indica TaxID=4628 RepID=A0AAQ3QFB8_9LILI|nr:hypothetical protein Cni_G16046 [Canna indica]